MYFTTKVSGEAARRRSVALERQDVAKSIMAHDALPPFLSVIQKKRSERVVGIQLALRFRSLAKVICVWFGICMVVGFILTTTSTDYDASTDHIYLFFSRFNPCKPPSPIFLPSH